MPTPIDLPPCLLECCELIFPKLDFSRIEFFVGFPPLVNSRNGFTMPSNGNFSDIQIYLETYDPCSPDTFKLIVHELVHAVQIQGMTDGGRIPGSWATYYMSHYLGCGFRGHDCDNLLEEEAYDFSEGCNFDGTGKLSQVMSDPALGIGNSAPCDCMKEAWPVPRTFSPTIGATTYIDILTNGATDLRMEKSSVGRTWCSLLNWPIAIFLGSWAAFGFKNRGGAIGAISGGIIGAVVGGIVGFGICGPLCAALGAWLGGMVGGFLGGLIGSLIGGLFSSASARIWFTARNFSATDGGSWVIPDIPISQDGNTKTSHGPALAAYSGKLYAAYKARSSNDIWYNVLDLAALSWLVKDIKISQDGHTKTNVAPALAAYNGKLYLVHKASTSNDIWYNVFDGTSWGVDVKISQDGHTKTNVAPALAVYNGKLYLVHKASTSNDIWYNVFDGTSWGVDVKISQDGHTKTNVAPALAVYNGKLYLVHKASTSNDIWYNVFDGSSWGVDVKISRDGHTKTNVSPAVTTHAGKLYLAHKASTSNDIWYNVFDGTSWGVDEKITRDGKVKTKRGPALADFNSYLFMVYRDSS